MLNNGQNWTLVREVKVEGVFPPWTTECLWEDKNNWSRFLVSRPLRDRVEVLLQRGDIFRTVSVQGDFYQQTGKVYTMDFKVFEIKEVEDLGTEGYGYAYEDEEGRRVELHNAAPILKGHVKWDGCCNISRPDRLMGPRHLCGLWGFQDDLKIITDMYRICSIYMPDCAEGAGLE